MRIAPLASLVAVAALLGAHACGGHKSCVHDSDCGSGENCSYAMNGGCSAQGECATWDNQCADPPHQICGCDGKTIYVNCGYPGSPVPTKGAGACATPTGMSCSSATDCDPTAACAYAIADGCGAKGVCVEPDRSCVPHLVAACACDGTSIEIGCAFGAGNAVAPVRSMGSACEAGVPFDAGDANANDAAD